MMCETMANVPVEDKSSYVLTEDMIDAAMNEQFSYQEDLESEGELSSVEENVEQDSQESCVVENNKTVVENNITVENEALPTNPTVNIKANINVDTTRPVNVNPSSPIINNNKLSVLVIETGLDKNGSDQVKSIAEAQNGKEQQISNTSGSSLSGTEVTTPPSSYSAKSVGSGVCDSKEGMSILRSIFSGNNDKDSIIDLCESEAGDCSEEDDDANEAESIDEGLKSVMETNLMAEIGMPVNKKPPSVSNSEPNVENPVEDIGPRISVKNITQITRRAFNNMPEFFESTSEGVKNKINENPPTRNMSFAIRNPIFNANMPINGNCQGPSSIHINKIAVPHSSFLNNNGQRMKCVYVKSTSTLPFVINTPTQTTATNSSNMKYVLTQSVKKGPVQMSAIAALKTLTKNIQPQTVTLPKNAKVLTVAQKLQKQLLPNPMHIKIRRDGPSIDALKNSLIFSAKKTYTPPSTFPEIPTYTCIDCNDKFLSKMSLTNHIERRSMVIRFWCQTCKMEIQFFNKCALSIHLRGHCISLKTSNINTAFINITPIPKEMLEKGITTMFLKDGDQKAVVPAKSTFDSNKATQSNTSVVSSADARGKAVTTSQSDSSGQKITTIAGQSKSVCYQSASINDNDRPVTTPVVNTNVTNKKLPLILPRAPKAVNALALVTTKPLSNHMKNQSASSSDSQPKNLKSLILLCNKFSSSDVQQNSIANTLTPDNIAHETDSRVNSSPNAIDNNDTEMIIDDDVSLVPSNKEEEIVDVENVDVNVTTESPTVPESEKILLEQSPFSSSQPAVNKRNCSECKAYCPNIGKHLNGVGRPLRAELACKICNLILPSKCALKIHHRIHLKISPYKCPDCGKDFTSWDELHAHLKFSCGHFAKCVRYLCKGCKAHFPTQNGLAHHIVKNHGKDIFKCSLCPVAFYKKPSLLKHITNDHPKEKNKAKLGMDYKQCEMCPKKLLPEENYLLHAKEHTNAMIYGYKCSMCNIVYANKMAFIIHQIKEKTKKDSLEKSVLRNTVSEEHLEEKSRISDSNSDFEDEPVIIRKFPENENDSSVTEKDPLSLDDWEYTPEQKVKEKTEELCIVCKKNSVVLLPGIDLNRQSLCCKQCVKPLDGDSSTEINKGHTINAASHSKSKRSRPSKPKNIYRSSSTDEVMKVTKKRRISDVSLSNSLEGELMDPLADSPSRKKNKRKTKEKLDSIGQTHIQGQVIKSRSLDELSLKCAKCEFVSENREAFLKHITVHRTDPNTYQCLECGLCFVVLPSLEIHLQMHHGILDSGNYTENNKASLPQKVTYIEEETQDNQCRVCYEIFDCKSSLDKHFRIHGMAFMSRLSKSP